MAILPLLALFAACTQKNADTSGAGEDSAADSGDSARDTVPVDTGPWWEDSGAADVDGDGVTEAQGDCDDLDGDVHPGATDTCDGVDQDCDGALDEDFGLDTWEPNDAEASWLGALVEDDPQLLFGYVWEPEDVDGYAFSVEDSSWSWFSVEAWLYDVPPDADIALELRWVEDVDGQDQGVVAYADDGGPGEDEVLDWGGSAGTDDGGRYELWLTSSGGGSCAVPYTLEMAFGGW